MRLGIVVSAILIAPVLTPTAVQAQSFDVASIKPDHSTDRVMLFQPARGGRFTAAIKFLVIDHAEKPSAN